MELEEYCTLCFLGAEGTRRNPGPLTPGLGTIPSRSAAQLTCDKGLFPTWHRRPSCYFSVAITGVALKSTAVSSSNCCSTATGQLLSGLVRLDLPPAAASKCGFVVLFTNKCLRFRGWGENALAQKGRGAASWLSLFTGVTERASICSAKRKKTTTLKVPSYNFLCVCLSIFQTPCKSLWLLSGS